MIRLIFSFVMVFLVNTVFGQADCKSKDLQKVKAKINYEKDYGERKLSKIKKGEFQISFRERFSDTVITCIGSEYYRKDFVLTDTTSSLGVSTTFFNLKRKIVGKRKVKLIVASENIYLEFMLPSKYKLIKIYKYGQQWVLNFTNTVSQLE